MPPKKKQKVDQNTFQFDLTDLFTPTPSQNPHFSVESFSADGRRVRKDVHIAEPPSPLKKAAGSRPVFDPLEDASNDANPWSSYDFGLEGQTFQVAARSTKKRRYLSSVRTRFCSSLILRLISDTQDEPLKQWTPYRDEYLAEFITLEGRGYGWTSHCKSCPEGVEPGEALYRCRDCFHTDLVCLDCSLRAHQDRPLDVIEVRLQLVVV